MIPSRKHPLLSLCSAIAMGGVCLSAPAAAQTIDYAQFERMFGEPISTSATGTPQRASDVPAAMTIIPGDSLRKVGAKTIAEALRGVAGIDVTRFTAQQYEVAVRGGNQPFNPRVLVMINGRQIYLDHYGFTSWSNLGIELSEIRQIEIVRGPVSALFGFNAASGAINIITYSPSTDAINHVSGQVGSDGAYSVSGVATLPLGERGGARFSGGYAEEDEFPATTAQESVKPYRENLALDAEYALAESVSARLNYSYSRSDQYMEAIYFIPVIMDIRTHGVQGSVAAETGMGLLEASVVYNDLTNLLNIIGTSRQDRLDSDVLVARVQDVIKPTSADIVRISLEYRANKLTSRPDLIGAVSYDVYSGGLMWDHRLSDALALNLSGRVDHLALSHNGAIGPTVMLKSSDFERGITSWSANAGLVFKPDADSTIRLQAARGVQVPSLLSLGVALDVPFTTGVEARFRGNPRLDPVIVESAEIGYVRSIALVKGDISTTLFLSRTRAVVTLDAGLPSFTPTGPVVVATLSNSGQYDSYGVETILRGQIGALLRWRLDYTFNAMTVDFQPYVAAPAQPFKALTPRHKLGVRMGYERGDVTLAAQGLLRSKVVFPATGRVSGWTFGLNMRAAWRPVSGVELFAVGENMTGADFIDNGVNRQDVRGRMGVDFSF